MQDHFFSIIKNRVVYKMKENKKPTPKQEKKEVFKVYLFNEDSIRYLYQNKLNQELNENEAKNDMEQEWLNLEKEIKKAALEALGVKRKYRKRKGLRICNQEVQQAIKARQETYLKCVNNPKQHNREAYKEQRNKAKQEEHH